jgi:hypothetical protein
VSPLSNQLPTAIIEKPKLMMAIFSGEDLTNRNGA